MLLSLGWYIPLAILLSIVLQTDLCHAADNEDFADFHIEKLGETAFLYCNSTTSNQAKAIPQFYEPIAWMLPNLKRVDRNDEKYELQENNWTLVVNGTVLEDLGVYHCMLLNDSHSGNYYLVKVGLNAEGPYFFDMWEKYMWPTIIAICCFFGFLFLAAVAVVLYHFRYIPPKKDDDDDDDESEREAEVKADGDSIKASSLADDEIHVAASLPPYNGNGPYNYENPSFKEDEDNAYEVSSKSDDEDLTSF